MSIKPPLLALGMYSTLLAGCADPKAEEMKAAANRISQLTNQCHHDTEGVPAEHSMHCIEAAKILFNLSQNVKDKSPQAVILREHCRDSDSKECSVYSANRAHSWGLYWKAIAKSIAIFGMPEGAEETSSLDKLMFYKVPDLMRERFDKCLEEHPDPTKPDWLKKQESEPFDPETPVPITGEIPESEQCISLGKNKPPVLPD